MIRLVEPKDTEACYRLTKEVYGAFMLDHGIELIEADLRNTVNYFVNSKQVLVVEHDGEVCGLAAWMITAHPANMKCKIWQEVLWALKSKYKTDALLLMRAMESQAKSVGANVMVLANLSLENEPALRRIYQRRGFNYMESHYSRRW